MHSSIYTPFFVGRPENLNVTTAAFWDKFLVGDATTFAFAFAIGVATKTNATASDAIIFLFIFFSLLSRI